MVITMIAFGAILYRAFYTYAAIFTHVGTACRASSAMFAHLFHLGTVLAFLAIIAIRHAIKAYGYAEILAKVSAISNTSRLTFPAM
jgi:hypothetical protein